VADISPSVYAWNTTESVNAPQGTAIAGAGIDDNLRAIQAGVKKCVAAIGADIAASGTVNLANATGNTVNITGSASISSLGTVASGAIFTLLFASQNTLVHSANLVLPGNTNVSVSAGDVFTFLSRGSGAWTCIGATPNVTPGGLPIGASVPWFAPFVPSGYILAAGQTLNRTVYSQLFGILGTTYNTGGEAGTDFRIPDLRGRFLAGLDNMGGSAASRITTYATATTVGATGGDEQPHAHAHTASSASALTTHTHAQTGSVGGTTSATDTNHYHAVNINSGLESQGHNHNYLDTGGQVVGGLQGAPSVGGDVQRTTDTENQTHYHNVSGNTAWQSDSGFGNWQHSHTFSASISGNTGSTDLAHVHGVTVDSTGSGSSGNLPPVMFVNWIIRAY
jgi:microcystin-dependent protein